MAQSPSPTMGNSHLIDRQQSHSPPPTHQQQLSKRDKRRSQLANRLEEITKVFSENRDGNYRTQLQALQCDMNIIMEADPYGSLPLPDSRTEIEALVQANMQKAMMKAMNPDRPLRAGKLYEEFARDVNNAIEERDATLTRHLGDFETRKSNIQSSQMYRRRLAELEHKSLRSTIRDRLINSVATKKARLHKDKDILEIGEGNAMLLHPSQFSVSNPGSPGGLHGKRATRNRREPEELLNSTESHRRKRKAHDSDESPAPKRLPTSTEWPDKWPTSAAERGPLRQGQQTKEYLMSVQFDSSLFSIEKMFSDKELAMSYHSAAMAAHAYMVRQPNSTDEIDSPANGTSESSAENPKGIAAETEPEDAPSPPPGMERQPSHATRSTRNPFASSYLNVDLITANKGLYTPPDIQMIARQIPKMPPLINLMGTRTFTRNDPVVTLSGLNDQEAASEIEFIKRARAYNDEHGYGRNLDVDLGARELLANAALPSNPYEHWVKASAKKSNTNPNAPMSSLRDELPDGQGLALGGVEMGRENSYGGGSMGGTAMSRQATDQSTRERIKRDNRRKNGV